MATYATITRCSNGDTLQFVNELPRGNLDKYTVLGRETKKHQDLVKKFLSEQKNSLPKKEITLSPGEASEPGSSGGYHAKNVFEEFCTRVLESKRGEKNVKEVPGPFNGESEGPDTYQRVVVPGVPQPRSFQPRVFHDEEHATDDDEDDENDVSYYQPHGEFHTNGHRKAMLRTPANELILITASSVGIAPKDRFKSARQDVISRHENYLETDTDVDTRGSEKRNALDRYH